MKTILILYSCIIFFGLRIYSAKATYPHNRLFLYIKYIHIIQNEIQNKIDRLTRYNVLFLLNTQFLWAIIHRITLKEIEFKISGVTSDTHKYIDSAIGNTTGHEHCYDKQHLEFEDVKNSAILVYYTCEAASIVQLSVPTAEMKEIAQKGKAAIEELEKILPACMVLRSTFALQTCIFATMRKTKSFIQAFMNKYKIISEIRSKRHKEILKYFDDCYDTHIRALQNKISKIGQAALKCIEGL